MYVLYSYYSNCCIVSMMIFDRYVLNYIGAGQEYAQPYMAGQVRNVPYIVRWLIITEAQ